MTIDDAAIERLVTDAQQGDAWAFGMIFDHYHESIYRFIASRVNRPSDAEDLTQHVFVKALEALPRYESRGIPFGGWLFRLARNCIIDFVRTRHEHAELDAIGERQGPDAGPDEIAVNREDMDAVGVALAYVLVPEGIIAMVWSEGSRWLPNRTFNFLPGSVFPTDVGPTPPQGYSAALLAAVVWMTIIVVGSFVAFRRQDINA